jgi:hypothetical protein
MIGEKPIRFKQPNAQDERGRNVTTRGAGHPRTRGDLFDCLLARATTEYPQDRTC